MKVQNPSLKSEIEEIFIINADKHLSKCLKEEISLWKLLQRLQPTDFLEELSRLVKQIGLGGSAVSGKLGKNSDIDILFFVEDLDSLKQLFEKYKIPFECDFFDPKYEVLGRHNNLYSVVGKYKGYPVELYFEEYPIYLQSMPVHIKFSLKIYKNYPEVKRFTDFLKDSFNDSKNPFGYRKAPTFYSEIIFINDLGFLPKKTENAPRGDKVPAYDGLSPGDWIYAKEVFGKGKAIKLLKGLHLI